MQTNTIPGSTEISSAGPSFEECMRRLGYKAHPEQNQVARYLDEVRGSGKVSFIEAPTATGKTFVIAHHVLDHVAETAACYVIAVPTIELGHQTLSAIQRIQHTSRTYLGIKASIILGRQEFLSPAGLEDLIDAFRKERKADIADAIDAWLKDGAPGRSDDHPRYTVDGLERWLDTNMIKERISDILTLGPSDAGSEADKAYRRQFEHAAKILVVTHAMLARDLITRFVATSRERRKQGMQTASGLTAPERWLEANDQRLAVETGDEGRLPDYRRLIVDEAHLLRENFENATRTGISLSALVRHIEQINKSNNKLASAATLKAVRNIRQSLANQPNAKAGNRIQIDWGEPDAFSNTIEKLYAALETIKTSKAPDDLENNRVAIEQARYALREAINARSAVSTTFEWSPIAAFPTISIGRRNLTQQFMLLWSRLQSAALISATLYTENVSGPSIGYIANRLAVPEAMRKPEKPVKASWLIAPVTVLMPTERHVALIPSDEPNQRSAWLDAVAGYITSLSMNSKGALVLNTRRSDSQQLSERLALLVDPSRIIDGSNGRMSALKQQFIQASEEGLSPIWLAQGPAWTGLDLPDHLLDALMITRLPFPLPDAVSTTGEKIGIYGSDKIARMTMTFKQGLGRLVRSRETQAKTFVMLDGRILTLKNLSGVRKHLSAYDQKTLPL